MKSKKKNDGVGIKDAVGILGSFIADEHIYTFMLSSPFTARNIVKQVGDEEKVKQDLAISLGLSIGTSVLLGAVFESPLTAVAGTAFGVAMYYIYAKRSELFE